MNSVVAQANRAWIRDITGGLTIPDIASYLLLWDRVENAHQAGVPDRCLWRWTEHKQFTTKSAYMMMHQGSTTFDCAKLVWKTWAPLKVKLFLRIAFKERLWTVERRQRHGLVAAAACHLCNQAQETVHHLFVSCPFTLQVSETILRRLGVTPTPLGNNYYRLGIWPTYKLSDC